MDGLLLPLLLLALLPLVRLQGAMEDCPKGCYCVGLTVICRKGGLKMIPMDIPLRTRSLSIQLNPIMKLKMGSFENFENLKLLDLSRNQIMNVSADAFMGLTSLKRLILRSNKIYSLPKDVFTPLMMTLDELDLSGNMIKVLPESVESLLYLSNLMIMNNPLKCMCDILYLVPILRDSEPRHKMSMCKEPMRLKGKYIRDLEKTDLDCSMDEEMTYEKMMMPEITKQLNSHAKAQGDRTTFTCNATGSPPPKFTWEIPTNNTRFIKFLQRNRTLKISEIHDYHSGVYTCFAENMKGKVRTAAMLRIIDAMRPQIVVGPLDAEVYMGADVTMQCKAMGQPVPVIQWMWYRPPQMKLSNSRKYTVKPNMLIIHNATVEDSRGKYVCYTSNLAGSAQVSATLRVLKMPDTNSKKGKMDNNSTQYQNITLDNEDFVRQVIEKAKERVEAAIRRTAERLSNPDRRRTSADIQTLFRQPNEAALELAKAAEVYEAALEEVTSILRQHQHRFNFSGNDFVHSILTPEQLSIISQLSGCQGQNEEILCEEQLCFHKQYRSIDGTCNNFNKPRQAAALSPFKRLLLPEYENGVNMPIGWQTDKQYYGFPKPRSRLVSTELLAGHNVTQDEFNSAMLMQWGQFLDHDLDFTPVDASNSRFSDGLSCNETCVNDPPCFPILIPPNDPRIRRRCIGFTRSSATCGSGSTSILLGRPHYREQINQITSYLDASNVYGSDELQQSQLRQLQFEEGELRTGVPTPSGKRLMPFNVRGQVDCQTDASTNVVACFKAGDPRSNENLGLLSMHTIWMREHNRIVKQLRKLNPHWTGDKLYYEGRKIVGAYMQHITYNHWLPYIIGDEGMIHLGAYRGYDDDIDSTISNAFATAAFRFGHTLINPILYRLDENFNEIPEGHLPLHKAFFAPDILLEQGGIDPLLRGLLAAGAKKVTPYQPFNQELTEKLFLLAHEVALDLAALNIQRGRDHGLPGYNMYRKFCGLVEARTFDDFSEEITSPEIRERMRRVYGHPGNVDLFLGGVLETPLPGAKVGPTFRCILVDQFRRLRDGDRFWYENPEVFTPTQQSQIRRVSLSRVLCDNGDNITRVQKDAFRRPQNMESYMQCDYFPTTNFLPWKECISYIPPLPHEQVPENRRRRRSAPTMGCDKKEQASQNKDESTIQNILQQIKDLQKEYQKLKLKVDMMN